MILMSEVKLFFMYYTFLECVARKTISINVSIPILVHQAVEPVNYIPYSFSKYLGRLRSLCALEPLNCIPYSFIFSRYT